MCHSRGLLTSDVFVTVSRLYFVNNGDFLQDLDQAVSYLQRLECAAMTEQRASLK